MAKRIDSKGTFDTFSVDLSLNRPIASGGYFFRIIFIAFSLREGFYAVEAMRRDPSTRRLASVSGGSG
jgi:hypothetical protein